MIEFRPIVPATEPPVAGEATPEGGEGPGFLDLLTATIQPAGTEIPVDGVDAGLARGDDGEEGNDGDDAPTFGFVAVSGLVANTIHVDKSGAQIPAPGFPLAGGAETVIPAVDPSGASESVSTLPVETVSPQAVDKHWDGRLGYPVVPAPVAEGSSGDSSTAATAWPTVPVDDPGNGPGAPAPGVSDGDAIPVTPLPGTGDIAHGDRPQAPSEVTARPPIPPRSNDPAVPMFPLHGGAAAVSGDEAVLHADAIQGQVGEEGSAEPVEAAAPSPRAERHDTLQATAAVRSDAHVAEARPATPAGRPPSIPLSASAERVLQVVERLEHVPPPRSMVVELPDTAGAGRLHVALRGAMVHITPLGGDGALDAFRTWAPQLAEALQTRGLDLANGFNHQQRRDPTPDPDAEQPHPNPTRPRPRRDDGLRI